MMIQQDPAIKNTIILRKIIKLFTSGSVEWVEGWISRAFLQRIEKAKLFKLVKDNFGDIPDKSVDGHYEFLIKNALKRKEVSELKEYQTYFNIEIDMSKDKEQIIHDIWKSLNDGTPVKAFRNLVSHFLL